MNIRRIIGPFVLAWLTVCACTAKQHITASDSVLLQRIYAYAEPLRKDLEGQQMNVYSRFMINTLKKNRLLRKREAVLPSLFLRIWTRAWTRIQPLLPVNGRSSSISLKALSKQTRKGISTRRWLKVMRSRMTR